MSAAIPLAHSSLGCQGASAVVGRLPTLGKENVERRLAPVDRSSDRWLDEEVGGGTNSGLVPYFGVIAIWQH